MSKYIKSNTTYTLRKRSQGINGGAIFERDWSTLDGQVLRFGKGKVPLYNDGNFIFTTGNFKFPSRKNKAGEVVATYTYDDVKEAKETVNSVQLNTESNDIRSFAYYGSCVELVESSITNIIATFPASIYVSEQMLEYQKDEETYSHVTASSGRDLYIVKNPFGIDLLSKSVTLGEYDNKYRFMCESYEDYVVGGESMVGFKVDYSLSDCKEDDQWYNFEEYREKTHREAPIIVTFYTGKDGSGETVFLGYRVHDEIVFLCEYDTLVIKPKESVIEAYFDSLRGFEKQLLNRASNPLYMNTFITPVEGDMGYKYVKRNYRWPTVNGYCIDIESASYDEFVQKLLKMATLYDELWCDNLYGKMTHEAIKNFDWTYTRDYLPGEEQDNIDGGLRMQRILRLIARIFDEKKQYIDGIKNTNKVSYGGLNNVPDALLSDKLELLGWDTVSTIPLPKDDAENKGYVKLSKDYLDANNLKWYSGSSIGIIDTSTFDVNFMKRLLLSSRKILSSKGTQEAIEMVMGMFGFGLMNPDKPDFEIIERSYRVTGMEDVTRGNVQEINAGRTDYADEDDDFSKLPLAELFYNEIDVEENGYTKYRTGSDKKRISKSLIIPFYDKGKDYGHELYFQSKGGWGELQKHEIFNEYLETISYLNIVSTVGDLFKNGSDVVNPNDIYYVVSLDDYTDYYRGSGQNVSHFFYYLPSSDMLATPTRPQCWHNIGLDDKEDEHYKKAMYLDGIMNTKFGNNPHCGFGWYDNGDEFRQYMEKPYKYFVDENELSNTDKAEYFGFDVNEVSGRRKTMAETEYNETEYYLNSKVVVLKNRIDSPYYKKYFKDVILKYLLQAIPSTTILLLEDF